LKTVKNIKGLNLKTETDSKCKQGLKCNQNLNDQTLESCKSDWNGNIVFHMWIRNRIHEIQRSLPIKMV